MNLLTIAWKSIRQRLLSSSLTGLSVALGVALMIAVLILNNTLAGVFGQRNSGFDMIIGPKGSETQLVMSTLYRIEKPIENLPWRYYLDWKKNDLVEHAIPVSIGDTSEEGQFPIVGTTVDYFRVPYGYDGPKPLPFGLDGELPGGMWDSVIGWEVARKNNWKIGTKFRMVHSGAEGHVHDEKFTVRGILGKTGTPNDRTVFVNIDGFNFFDDHQKPIEEAIAREAEFFQEPRAALEEKYAKQIAAARRAKERGGHVHSHDAPLDIQKEVSAIFIVAKDDPNLPGLGKQVFISSAMADLKEGIQAQGVIPTAVMRNIMDKLVGNIRLALMILTGMIIAVSGIGIFVSIYNSMSERRREIAIMRALGARRITVLSIILAEAILLCVGGFFVGLLLGHGAIALGAPLIESRSGLLLERFAFDPIEFTVLPAIIALAALVGIVPALTAYRTDVADALAH